MKKALLFLVVFSVFWTTASASHAVVLEPVQQTIEGEEVLDLGLIGPGQKVEIVVNRGSGEQSPAEREALWDKVIVLADSLPPGWTKEDSKYYEKPLRAFVTADKNAGDGVYYFSFKVVDEYEAAPTQTVKCKVEVSREVLETRLLKASLEAGVGQPVLYYFRLKNKSSASDVFELTVSGLPGEWTYSKNVFVPYASEKLVSFEVAGTERGSFNLEFTVTSLSSDAIQKKLDATLSTKSDLYKDMQATARGILLFPSVEQTLYALFGLLTNLQ